MSRHFDFETRAIHGGTSESGDFRSTAPAIYPSTTYTYDDIDKVHEALAPTSEWFAYTRNANPTVRALEQCMASVEESEDSVAFGSGMAAIHAAILASGIRQGQTILAAHQLYGGSRSLLISIFGALGFNFEQVDTGNIAAVHSRLNQGDVGVLLFEPLSNPLIRICDVPGLIECAHPHGTRVIVDNTFASPVLLRPATLGADFVVESATKYLGGHGDVMAGIVACNSTDSERVRAVRTSTGGTLGPFEAWLVLRGIRTLGIRVARHCQNALALAQWLTSRPDITNVFYPGLDSDSGHAVAARLFPENLFGGMLAFDTGHDVKGVNGVLNRLKLAVPGTSLGDVETLVLHPVQASHRSLTAEERHALGIGDGLIRVSVGLESVSDLIADFDQALSTV